VLGAREEGAWWLRAEEMASSMRRFLNPLVLNIQKMELELTCPVWYPTSPRLSSPIFSHPHLSSLDLDAVYLKG
jgi:hypothetical protein